MLSDSDVKQDIMRISICVTGLTLMTIGIYFLIDRCNISVVLGSATGSTASVINYVERRLTAHMFAARHINKTAFIWFFSKAIRLLFVSSVAFVIILNPAFDDTAGIASIFFAPLSHIIAQNVNG